MRSSVLAGLFAFAGFSSAFSDSSPWIVASTASFEAGQKSEKLMTSESALQTTKKFLSTCPTEKYVIVVQPGLHYADLAVEGGSAMKELLSVVDSKTSNGKMVVPEVIGKPVSGMDIEVYISEACSSSDTDAQATYIELPALPSAGESRVEALATNDADAVANTLRMLQSDSYTLILIGAPVDAAEPTAYEPEFEETLMMELKRNVQGKPSRRADNETDWNKLPLFEKYQFFTPAIFMGLFATILMLTILTVGIRGLSSLEIPYGAFEKDMGPAAQKKQQ